MDDTLPVGCLGLGRMGGLPRNVQCLGGNKKDRPVAVVAPFKPEHLFKIRRNSADKDTGDRESGLSSSLEGNSLDVFHVHMHIKGQIGVKFSVKRNKLYIDGE